VLPARGGHWLVGNDWRDITATEREDDPLFYVNQHRFWLQYVDRNGTPGARLRRTFSEDPQDPIARRDDEFSDVVGEPRDGSGVSFARAIGDAYVLAGVQGRRDAFVLRMEQRQ
jgi:hypothetical protein